MIFWESDLNFVTVLLDAINLGHLLLQKPNGAGDRRVHAATIIKHELFSLRYPLSPFQPSDADENTLLGQQMVSPQFSA